MPHVITLPCIGSKDTACVSVCPTDCIHPTSDEAEFQSSEMLFIDPDACIDCGTCVAACPAHAIFLDSDVPAEWHEFIERNAAHYRK